ncbi:MAG: tetratricopeptide repeat protein [Oligoflexia bacterium]|nr:tetratricopeptide repeat protein [Oligoflexia bacterium]
MMVTLVLVFQIVIAGITPVWAADARLQLAEMQIRNKQWPQAKKNITDYLNSQETAAAYVDVGRLYARYRKWPESLHYLEIAFQRESKNPSILYDLALAQHQNKKIDESIESLRQAIRLKPKWSLPVFSLGEILELAQERYEARQVYVEAVKNLGSLAELRSRLCWINYQDGFIDETARQCALATVLNGKDDRSWALLGKSLYDAGKREKAFLALKQGLSKNPTSSFIRRAKGLIYFQEKSYEQAAFELGKAFGLNPQDEESAIHLARSLFEIQEYKHALPVFVEACRLNRVYRFDLSTKARELLRIKKNEEAALYEAALEGI